MLKTKLLLSITLLFAPLNNHIKTDTSITFSDKEEIIVEQVNPVKTGDEEKKKPIDQVQSLSDLPATGLAPLMLPYILILIGFTLLCLVEQEEEKHAS